MQEYKDIDIDSLISDGPDTINKNFKTLMSNNAGGEFPTYNLYAGMTCYRSDEGKIYTLKNDLSTWVELFDISGASGAVAPLAGALTKTLSIANGGTGATTASDACKNLGAVQTVNGKEPDAGGNVNVEKYTHPNSGVTAGTYRSVTVNAQGHVTGGSNPTLAIANGGTGATTASAALSNLGGVPTSDVSNSANKIPRYNSNGHLVLPNGSEFWIG